MALNDFRAIFLPYVLEKQKDGSYVAKNREYKPLGNCVSKWEKEQNFPEGTKLKGLSPKIAKKISWEGKEDLDLIFLYNDGCVPSLSKIHMDSYLKRLAILCNLQKQDY